jgi:hypothetical protein
MASIGVVLLGIVAGLLVAAVIDVDPGDRS